MAIDPVTASLIIGGADFLGSAFGGPSEGEKAARDQVRLQKRQFEQRERRRDDALGIAQARERAQRALRNSFLQNFASMRPRSFSTAAMFTDPTNPFAAGGGPGGVLGPGSGVRPTATGPDPLEAIKLGAAQLGEGKFAIPNVNRRARQARPRSTFMERFRARARG